MPLFNIAEVFGYAIGDLTTQARDNRERRWCPFRGAPCNKVSSDDPLGICSLSDGNKLATVCPTRFIEGARIFTDAGRLAFGLGQRVVGVPEVHILRTRSAAPKRSSTRIGKVDYLVARLDANDRAMDFAALEVQAVYLSGRSIRPAFRSFLANGSLPPGAERRPDWRSSAQKRLMPQLSLKVPVFRRWGKKFFVAVDSAFFEALPPMRTIDNVANSEITWLVYPFSRKAERFTIGEPSIAFTMWDDVLTALREGEPPEPLEILKEIERKAKSAQLAIYVT